MLTPWIDFFIFLLGVTRQSDGCIQHMLCKLALRSLADSGGVLSLQHDEPECWPANSTIANPMALADTRQVDKVVGS